MAKQPTSNRPLPSNLAMNQHKRMASGMPINQGSGAGVKAKP
jgi:hypothetical protein